MIIRYASHNLRFIQPTQSTSKSAPKSLLESQEHVPTPMHRFMGGTHKLVTKTYIKRHMISHCHHEYSIARHISSVLKSIKVFNLITIKCQREKLNSSQQDREGKTITGGHLHHPGALYDKEGVVHPRGWGYVLVAMCLISLSLLCSWFGTILMYPELCYCSWILWCFSPSTLLWWIEFPLWSYLIGLSL